MNIFFVTDNRLWFEYLSGWKKQRTEVVALYCSPAGAHRFQEDIALNRISVIDLVKESRDLAKRYDVGFSCHCKQLFPESLVETLPCFNFHPGYNPYNRGWFPQVFSIINGAPAGCTLHKMDAKIDHGPIVDQIEEEINAWDTSKDVYDRLLRNEFVLFEKWIDVLLAGDIEYKIPADIGGYNSIRDFERLCEIDLDKQVSFGHAIDYLRAMTFEGYKNAFFYDKSGNKISVSIELMVENVG
jgi:methionyl-tRNA formyltransferase